MTDVIGLASLWSSRVEAEQSRLTVKLSPEPCSPPRTDVAHSSLHGGAVSKNSTFCAAASEVFSDCVE